MRSSLLQYFDFDSDVLQVAAEHAAIKLDVRPRRLQDVAKALNTTRAIGQKGYVRAILAVYVQAKLQKRSKFEVHLKLQVLEHRMPHFAKDFRAVRAEFGLQSSEELPAPIDPDTAMIAGVIPSPPPYISETGSGTGTCSCSCTCGVR